MVGAHTFCYRYIIFGYLQCAHFQIATDNIRYSNISPLIQIAMFHFTTRYITIRYSYIATQL